MKKCLLLALVLSIFVPGVVKAMASPGKISMTPLIRAKEECRPEIKGYMSSVRELKFQFETHKELFEKWVKNYKKNNPKEPEKYLAIKEKIDRAIKQRKLIIEFKKIKNIEADIVKLKNKTIESKKDSEDLERCIKEGEYRMAKYNTLIKEGEKYIKYNKNETIPTEDLERCIKEGEKHIKDNKNETIPNGQTIFQKKYTSVPSFEALLGIDKPLPPPLLSEARRLWNKK